MADRLASFTVVYDACVLYPAPLRDLLVRLATTGLFRAKWTNEIHDEWINALIANRPDLDRERLVRTVELMNQAVPDCLVVGYEHLIPGIVLPDAADRHVVAAAVRSNAQIIVTTNTRDFPPDVLTPLDIAALHPDEFVADLCDLNLETVCEVVREQRASLSNPQYTIEQLLETFKGNALTVTASILEPFVHLL